MAKRPILTDVGNILTSATTINTNYDAIEAAFDNTLSRDGSTPNQMLADIDLNDNDLLNVNEIQASVLTVSGVNFNTVVADTAANASAALASETAAANSQASAASSASAATASASAAAQSAADAAAIVIGEVSAVDIPITDTGGLYTATNVETALAEVATDVATNASDITALTSDVTDLSDGTTIGKGLVLITEKPGDGSVSSSTAEFALDWTTYRGFIFEFVKVNAGTDFGMRLSWDGGTTYEDGVSDYSRDLIELTSTYSRDTDTTVSFMPIDPNDVLSSFYHGKITLPDMAVDEAFATTVSWDFKDRPIFASPGRILGEGGIPGLVGSITEPPNYIGFARWTALTSWGGGIKQIGILR